MSDPEDYTDPKFNPLIPTTEGDPVDPLQTPEGNYLIPEWAYPQMPAKPAAAPAAEVPERPSVEFVEKVLAAFIDGSSAGDFERIKRLFKL